MTKTQACKAFHDMADNSPTAELASAEYVVDYYHDWAERTDGVLGESFGELARISKAQIDAGGPMPEEYGAAFVDSYMEVLRICGNPLTK